MLQPILQEITPNDFDSWQEFVDAQSNLRPTDRGAAYAWFLLTVGVEGFEGTTLFQVLISTPDAVARATGENPERRVLVVETFEPAEILRRIRTLLASAQGENWNEMVEQLQASMYWEHERQWC